MQEHCDQIVIRHGQHGISEPGLSDLPAATCEGMSSCHGHKVIAPNGLAETKSSAISAVQVAYVVRRSVNSVRDIGT
jgi:hypothetical protein